MPKDKKPPSKAGKKAAQTDISTAQSKGKMSGKGVKKEREDDTTPRKGKRVRTSGGDGESGGAAAGAGAAPAVPKGVHPSRVRRLNEADLNGTGAVVYWMSRDQRVDDNWALLYAQEVAKQRRVPMVVAFNLLPEFMGACWRHYSFMLRGLEDVTSRLAELKIPFVLLQGDALTNMKKFVADAKFSAVVCDFSPLRPGVAWRKQLAEAVDVPVFEVDAHNVVPVWVASDRLEYAARTFRPRVTGHLPKYLTDFPPVAMQTVKWEAPDGYSTAAVEWDIVRAGVKVDMSVKEVDWLTAGSVAGNAALAEFLTKPRLKLYSDHRNNPAHLPDAISGLSPYLHYGHLAAQRAAFEASKHRRTASKDVSSFLEELVVRRELSDNYCFHNTDGYDRLDGLYPTYDNNHWAQRTLADHAGDERQYVYTQDELDTAKTHDDLWNAAQQELVYRGKMHGFMRMYWAKKILEWTESPEEALRISIYLNDRYSLDGRDPNGFVGCAWSIAGLHDNAWTERPVFGKVRYMNYQGCKRKFNIAGYIAKVKAMVPRR